MPGVPGSVWGGFAGQGERDNQFTVATILKMILSSFLKPPFDRVQNVCKLSHVWYLDTCSSAVQQYMFDKWYLVNSTLLQLINHLNLNIQPPG